jgi:hypothetical protein
MLSEAVSGIKYSQNGYLQNIPVSYIEAIFEIVLILKMITGMDKRSSFFNEANRDSFDSFMDQLIDLGYIQFCMRCVKDLLKFLFSFKIHTVVIFVDFILQIYLNISHPKLSKTTLTKLISEICELLGKESNMALLKEHREDADVKDFLDNLLNITKKNPYLMRDTAIEIYFSQLGMIEDILMDKGFKLLNLHSPIQYRQSKMVERKISNNDMYNAPSQAPFTAKSAISNWEKVELQTSTYDFVITPVKQKKSTANALSTKIENQKNISSDPYDEYSILALLDYTIKESDFEKVNKIINWRKKILEVTKIHGWIIGKILAANTLTKYEINDIDIIEVNFYYKN